MPPEMAYRATSGPLLTEWSRFIDRVKRENDWSSTQAFEAVQNDLGLSPKSRTAFLKVITGEREPTAKEVAVMERVYGGRPTEQDEAAPIAVATSTDPALLAILARQTEAMEAQTAAINALVKRLDDLALGQAALAEEVGSVIDPAKARRRIAAGRNETPPERSGRGSRPWEEEMPEPASRGS